MSANVRARLFALSARAFPISLAPAPRRGRRKAQSELYPNFKEKGRGRRKRREREREREERRCLILLKRLICRSRGHRCGSNAVSATPLPPSPLPNPPSATSHIRVISRLCRARDCSSSSRVAQRLRALFRAPRAPRKSGAREVTRLETVRSTSLPALRVLLTRGSGRMRTGAKLVERLA